MEFKNENLVIWGLLSKKEKSFLDIARINGLQIQVYDFGYWDDFHYSRKIGWNRASIYRAVKRNNKRRNLIVRQGSGYFRK
jgi:hypothetical protein